MKSVWESPGFLDNCPFLNAAISVDLEAVHHCFSDGLLSFMTSPSKIVYDLEEISEMELYLKKCYIKEEIVQNIRGHEALVSDFFGLNLAQDFM